ncbi:MAG: hypothetical protein ACLSA6_04710 [Holdemania massiliensis]
MSEGSLRQRVLLKTVPMPLRGKKKNQRKHQIRQTAKEVVLECVK